MIDQLFTYDDWADIGTTTEQFYNCTLKVPIGKYEAGDILGAINVDLAMGLLTICDSSLTRSVSEHRLILTVV